MRRRGYKVRSTASLHLRAYIAGDDSRDEAQHRFDVSIRSIERTDACEEGGNETRHRRGSDVNRRFDRKNIARETFNRE